MDCTEMKGNLLFYKNNDGTWEAVGIILADPKKIKGKDGEVILYAIGVYGLRDQKGDAVIFVRSNDKSYFWRYKDGMVPLHYRFSIG